MPRVLILYSTVDGQTRRIAERLQSQMPDDEVSLAPLEQASPDWSGVDKVIIGASIRYGKFRPALHEFIHRHLAELTARPSAFFSVNLVARKPEKNTPATNPYMVKFAKQSPWQPSEQDVFAGKLNYPVYGFWDKQIIRFIMWLTKGPTDGISVVEYTDWQRVDAFATRIAGMK